ncbi:TVP38/TMEM64 family protein [Enterococcus faecalis]
MNRKKSLVANIIHWVPIIGIVFFIGLIIYGYSLGIFHSVHSLQTFISQFGSYGVCFFILLQIIQVIIPILPGGISSVAGMLMFGNLQGLLYSYVGLLIGEVIGFFLVRHYGKSFVQLILSPSKYQKFNRMLQKNEHHIKKLLTVTMLVPFAPDDVVCLIAGITDISFKEFMKIVLLLKFWSVATYSYLMLYLFEVVGKL